MPRAEQALTIDRLGCLHHTLRVRRGADCLTTLGAIFDSISHEPLQVTVHALGLPFASDDSNGMCELPLVAMLNWQVY